MCADFGWKDLFIPNNITTFDFSTNPTQAPTSNYVSCSNYVVIVVHYVGVVSSGGVHSPLRTLEMYLFSTSVGGSESFRVTRSGKP